MGFQSCPNPSNDSTGELDDTTMDYVLFWSKDTSVVSVWSFIVSVSLAKDAFSLLE